MLDKELTPPPDDRLSSSSGSSSFGGSGSPDSSYKSLADAETGSHATNSRIGLSAKGLSNYSNSNSLCKIQEKIALQKIRKTVTSFKLNDQLQKDLSLEVEWEHTHSLSNSQSHADPKSLSIKLSSPLRKRPPTLKKGHRARSRLIEQPETPTPRRTRGLNLDTNSASKSRECVKENCRPPRISSPIATPPHKRLRALQINTDVSRCQSSPVSSRSSPFRSKKISPRGALFSSGRRSSRGSPANNSAKKPSINPFTPDRTIKTANLLKNKTSCCSDSGFCDDSWLLDSSTFDSQDVDMETEDPSLDLNDMSTNRYKEEFCEESLIGSGEFGNVYKCVNKLDGCVYAIKRSREPITGKAVARVSRNEVYAEAVLGKHPHVVRYHSAWAEGGHLFIQNEFCNGGSLAEEIATHQRRGTRFTEVELKEVLRQVAYGLKYVHCLLLAHLDIKPGNIFIQYNQMLTQSPESGIEEDINEGSEEDELTDQVTYKIGDFGHVTQIFAPQDMEEGDCRYLPKEILGDDHSHLCKADIFALGLTIYQCATLLELPKNGTEWHKIRSGNLPYMKGYSVTFNNLVKSMVHPDPATRPTAALISSHPQLCPEHLRSRLELARALHEERVKNQRLSEQLKAVTENAELRIFNGISRPTTRASRLIGLQVNRSKSLTNF